MRAMETDEEQGLKESTSGRDFEKDDVNWLPTFFAFLFPGLGGACFGYDIGATSGALVSLKSAATSGTDWYQLSSVQSGLVVSLSLFGALAGSAAAFVVGDPLGRRKELILASVLYLLAGMTCYTAAGYNQLLLGRTLYGLGIGFAMHAAPAYIAETAPAKVRGLLISLKECLIVVGILTGYFTSYLFIDDVGGWRNMLGLTVFPAAALLLGMLWLPESPRWLMLSGSKKKQAKESIQRLRGSSATSASINAELESICSKADSIGSQNNAGMFALTTTTCKKK